MKFGSNLKELRKLKNLSQEDLAERVGVSRQSVSKWETGDAYPEMNNILMLCKIFNCKINDLLSNNLEDFESFDEEVKMNLVKFEKEKQNKMKTLTKILSLIGKIAGIVVKVAIPFVILLMIVTPCLYYKMVDGIEPTNSSDIQIVEHNDKSNIIYKDHTIITNVDNEDIENLKENINENGTMNFVKGEIELATIVVLLVILSKLLKHLEQLFDNINKGDTPFTLENVEHIKKMSYLMITCIILSGIISGISATITNQEKTLGFEIFDIVEILFLYSLSYIFEYGYEIQKDSKGKMYDE